MSRKSIGHPEFVYMPLSAAAKKRMQESALARLGNPPGYCTVMGAFFPLKDRDYYRKLGDGYSRALGARMASIIMKALAYEMLKGAIRKGLSK